MEKIKFLLLLFVAMLTVPLVQCTKEYNTDKQMQNASNNQKIITVSEAKDFIEGIGLQGMSTKSTDEDVPDENGYYPFIPGEYTLDWSKAIEADGLQLGCVDIPINAQNKYVAMSYYTDDDSTVFYAVKVIQKLIVVKKKGSDIMVKYLLSFIPDIHYSQGRYCKDVLDSFMNIGNKGDYSGLAVYTIPETGEVIRVSRYENGEYCGGVYLFDRTSDIEENNDMAFSYLDKISLYRVNNTPVTKIADEVIYLDEIIVRPKDEPWKKHKGEKYQLDVTIKRGGSDNMRDGMPDYKYPDPKDPGPRGWNKPSRDNSKGAPMSKKIFKNSTFTSEQWKILEEKINEIMQECIGSSLFGKLSGLLGDKRIVIRFDESAIGNYVFDGKSSVLTINPNKDAYYLFHEMFHVYQAYGEINKDSYKAVNLNLEFEAHFAVLRYMESNVELFNSVAYEKYIRHPIGASVNKLSSYLDDHGNLKPGESEAKYKEHISVNMVSAFRNHSKGVYNEERYKFDASRVGDMNFKNFRAVTKDC